MTTRAKRTMVAVVIVLVAGVAGLGADEARLWWATRNPGAEITRLAGLTGIGPGDTVAEIGAGPGEFARAFALAVGAEGRMLATELGPSRLATLRAATAGTNVQVVDGSANATSLPTGCCRVIYMRHVYHHFADGPAMARDLRRAVADSGRVAVIDFESRFGILSLLEPAGRGGHGVAMADVIGEMTSAGFAVEHVLADWTARTFLVVFKAG